MKVGGFCVLLLFFLLSTFSSPLLKVFAGLRRKMESGGIEPPFESDATNHQSYGCEFCIDPGACKCACIPTAQIVAHWQHLMLICNRWTRHGSAYQMPSEEQLWDSSAHKTGANIEQIVPLQQKPHRRDAH